MNKFVKFLVKIKDWFLDELYPNDIKCIFCETDVVDFENDPICDYCKKSHVINDGNKCMFCDVSIPEGNMVCDFCAGKHKNFVKAVCPFVYQTEVRRAVIKFKDDSAKYLAPSFAKFMCKRMSEESFDFDFIVPVPVHEKTLKRRGYNQAKLLADEISKITGKPVVDKLLVKTKLTKSQKNLSFEERQKNIEGSFSLEDKKLAVGGKFLIVDDIITTCATINSCAKLLKMAGAKTIFVAAIAINPLKKVK